MSERFFEQSILNSPYEYPSRHWELDARVEVKGYRGEDAKDGKKTG